MSVVTQYDSYGKIPVGFGKHIGIVVIDFQLAFTNPSFEMGGASLIDRAVGNTQNLLKIARASSVPVAMCVMGYHRLSEQPFWKIPACKKLIIGSPECELDPRVDVSDHDFKFVKSGPSIFFQTSLMTFLVLNRVDTIVVTGCVTSGCVRASVIDSFQYGFRTIVPEDCVGDHHERPHKDNLRDIGRRYADISNSHQIIEQINLQV